MCTTYSAREGEQVGIGVDARGACEGDGAAVGVAAGNVAQGACGAHSRAGEREGFGADRDATLKLKGSCVGNDGAGSRVAKRIGMLNVQDARSHRRGATVAVVARERPCAGIVFDKRGRVCRVVVDDPPRNLTCAASPKS